VVGLVNGDDNNTNGMYMFLG